MIRLLASRMFVFIDRKQPHVSGRVFANRLEDIPDPERRNAAMIDSCRVD